LLIISWELIFVSGLTGAEKTNLIEKPIQGILNLECLITYTTRPMRDGGENSYEYIFVNDKDYLLMKNKSSHWD
jgi:guanylate kinase